MKTLSLEKALGFSPKAEGGHAGASLRRIVLSQQQLDEVYRHWENQIRALAPSASEAGKTILNVVLDLGGDQPYVNLELAAGLALPDFSAIWPYCGWWQEELKAFGEMAFAGGARIEGVTWRLA